MPYVSAIYQAPDPFDAPDPPELAKPVEATDHEGRKHYMREDSQESWWLDYLANGGTIDPAVIPPITGEQVNRERDRRITGGFTYMGSPFQSDEFSQRNMADASQAADHVIAEDYRKAATYRWQIGATEDFYWIDADNNRMPMTAYDVRGLAQYMLRFKQRMIRCARDLKDLDPIPVDFLEDKYWVFTDPPEIPD